MNCDVLGQDVGRGDGCGQGQASKQPLPGHPRHVCPLFPPEQGRVPVSMDIRGGPSLEIQRLVRDSWAWPGVGTQVCPLHTVPGSPELSLHVRVLVDNLKRPLLTLVGRRCLPRRLQECVWAGWSGTQICLEKRPLPGVRCRMPLHTLARRPRDRATVPAGWARSGPCLSARGPSPCILGTGAHAGFLMHGREVWDPGQLLYH